MSPWCAPVTILNALHAALLFLITLMRRMPFLIFILLVRKVRPRELRENHRSTEKQSWSLNPGHLSSKSLLITAGCSYSEEEKVNR